MRTRNFVDIIQTYWGAAVTRFQPGYTVPAYTPEQFPKELQGEAINWKNFGGSWEQSDEAINEIIFSASQAYKSWFAQILKLPLPQNPLPEYEAWFNSTH